MDRVIPDAPGVVYKELRGLRLFRCTAHGATITDRACLANYRLAKSSLRVNHRAHLYHCVGCQIGACHAGEKPRARPIAARADRVCPRCRRKSARYVQSAALCVSCFNRMGEVKRGKNARGNAPVRLLQRAPVPHSVCFVHEGQRVQYNRLAVDSVEPMLAAVFLAKSPETLRFTFGRPDLEPVDNGPAPDWQRNSKREMRELDRERGDIQKQARASMRVGANRLV